MLTDFGAEHSFAAGGARLREHCGFSLNAPAVRMVTLAHAGRAGQVLAKVYQKSFRILPAKGARALVAEANGTMVCTVDPNRARAGKRPRQWKEMRLLAARAQGAAQAT